VDRSLSGTSPSSGIANQMNSLREALIDELELRGYFGAYLSEKNIQMTSGAILMLLIPLHEARQQLSSYIFTAFNEQDVSRASRENIENSLNKLLNDVIAEPAKNDLTVSDVVGQQQRTSLSVVKAFWQKFCNIPPFCGEK
jgi:ABC-type phosphate transport system auxiliary subunit